MRAHGKGAAKWKGNAHPYTALVNALKATKGIPNRMVNGLAANIFKAGTGIYPGQRPGKRGGRRS